MNKHEVGSTLSSAIDDINEAHQFLIGAPGYEAKDDRDLLDCVVTLIRNAKLNLSQAEGVVQRVFLDGGLKKG